MSTAVSVETWSGKDRGDENFPVGVLIRGDVRPHVHAFYAFARNADDIADSDALAPDDKLFRLRVMEDVLMGAAEDALAPSAVALRASLAATGVTARHARDLLDAFRQDATKLRYASVAELIDYCRLSAMPVGRHVLDLHREDPATHEPSDALCASLQILNHLQDCQKDFLALDRCYLPSDLLAAHGSSVEDLRGRAETPGLRAVWGALLDEVERLNRIARALPRQVQDRRLRLETAVILGLAARLARRLRAGDPVASRVKLTRPDVAAALASGLKFLLR